MLLICEHETILMDVKLEVEGLVRFQQRQLLLSGFQCRKELGPRRIVVSGDAEGERIFHGWHVDAVFGLHLFPLLQLFGGKLGKSFLQLFLILGRLPELIAKPQRKRIGTKSVALPIFGQGVQPTVVVMIDDTEVSEPSLERSGQIAGGIIE